MRKDFMYMLFSRSYDETQVCCDIMQDIVLSQGYCYEWQNISGINYKTK